MDDAGDGEGLGWADVEGPEEDLLCGDLTSIGLVNPFMVALQTVAAQVSAHDSQGGSRTNWISKMAGKLDRLINLLFRELLVGSCSRILLDQHVS